MDHAKIVLEAIRALRRRWWLLALVCGAGMAGTIVYAKTRPPYFETTAKILVESQQISSDLARSTVTLSAPARLQLIEQRLMARDNLIAMIEKLGLFADVPQLKSGAKVTLLRDATRIESISAAGQAWGTGDGLSAFTITVRLGDPEQAAAVANELVDSTITQNLRVRAERARQTLAYFEAEERQVGGALAKIEAEIADFKKANEDALPESLEERRATLVRLEGSSLDIDRLLLELEEKHADLSASLSGTGTGDTSAAALEESELRRLELELAQKRRVLGASHPDLRRLEQAVAAVTGLITPDPDMEVGAPTGPLADRRATTARLLNQVTEQIDRLHKQKQALTLQREQIDRCCGVRPMWNSFSARSSASTWSCRNATAKWRRTAPRPGLVSNSRPTTSPSASKSWRWRSSPMSPSVRIEKARGSRQRGQRRARPRAGRVTGIDEPGPSRG